MTHSFKDDDFLCERCGYVLNGLGPEANCPECGKPAYESHPENRTGNAWQRKCSLTNFIITVYATFRRPGVQFEHYRLDTKPSISFSFFVQLVTSVAYGALWSIVFYELTQFVSMLEPTSLKLAISGVIGSFVLLNVLQLIEGWGIRLFGKRNGWRLTRRAAIGICEISSPAWSIGLVGVQSILVISLLIFDWEVAVSNMNASQAIFSLYAFFIPPWLVGMLWFETLVYIGMRRMKFANPPEAAPPWSVVDALRARGDLKGEQK